MQPATHAEAEPADPDLAHIAFALLGQKADEVVRASGGGNSRIYRVRAGAQSYALKAYPAIERDPRDRLGTEKKTLQFFERNNIADVPRWLGNMEGYALLSWVEGELANPPLPHEMERAIAFIGNIKRLSGLPEACDMPPASEACVNPREILRQIEARLERLEGVAANEPALAEFMKREFMPAFRAAQGAAIKDYAARKVAFDAPLASGTCLIPADFGFHNAMRGPTHEEGRGAITFIDFEYFGWDDPVKLTADFLLHPAMKLDKAQRGQFRSGMLDVFGDDANFPARLSALTPLFALRWALILLNEFLPERWSGRAFARGASAWETAKNRQLEKARDMMKNSYSEAPDA